MKYSCRKNRFYWFWRHTARPLFILCLLLRCNTVLAESPDKYIPLQGLHKFSPGDNPAWSSPGYDDSKWKEINIPDGWSLGISPENGMGWYRIHFRPPVEFHDIEPAVFLGRIGDADEVFLNGIKIGGEGKTGNWFVSAFKKERLYRITEGLLDFDGDNLLAVRVMNYYSKSGIFIDKPLLGDYRDLRVEQLNHSFSIKVFEGAVLTFLSLFFLSGVFFIISGVKEKEYIFFVLFVFFYAVLYFIESLIFYETGFKTPLAEQIYLVATGLLTLFLFLFLISAAEQPFTPLIKSLVILSVILSPVSALANYSYMAVVFFTWVWIAQIMLLSFVSLYIIVRAYFRKVHEAGTILFGVISVCISVFFLTMTSAKVNIPGYLYFDDLGVLLFMVCLIYALSLRFARLRNNARALAGKILTANEEERKRFARDLHDSIGQSLSAVKINLQMMGAKTEKGIPLKKNSFPMLVSEVSDSIDELKNVAMALSPSFTEDKEIGDILVWYGKKFQGKSGIKVIINTGGPVSASQVLKDNLYRIFQEALGNVFKHSEATIVEITCKLVGSDFRMEIKDNGKGFDNVRAAQNGNGLGLSTMRERAELLLGGKFRIKSEKGNGTSLIIEAPVKGE